VLAGELAQFVRVDRPEGQFLVDGEENGTILFRWDHQSFSMVQGEHGRRM